MPLANPSDRGAVNTHSRVLFTALVTKMNARRRYCK